MLAAANSRQLAACAFATGLTVSRLDCYARGGGELNAGESARGLSVVWGPYMVKVDRRVIDPGRGAMGRPSKFDPNHRPTPPVDPVRKLSEGLLGAELHKFPTRLVITFDERRDATDVHKVLTGLRTQVSRAPRD